MRVAPTLMAFVAILVVSAFQSPFGAQLNSTEETIATLRGVVTAAGGAVIPNATLVISDAKTTRKIVTNEDGAYNIELPGGSYRLSTEITALLSIPTCRALSKIGYGHNCQHQPCPS